MRVALYERRSTNERLQADSLIVQDELLQQYAGEDGHEVIATYVDSASGRTVDGREDFQRLIATVLRGAKSEAILVTDISRWGRFDSPDEAGYYAGWPASSHGRRIVRAAFPGATGASGSCTAVRRRMPSEGSWWTATAYASSLRVMEQRIRLWSNDAAMARVFA